jgi:uncharacterized protein (DUF58 family)
MTNELFPKDYFAALQQVPLNDRYADYSNSAAARAAQQRSVNRREYQPGDPRQSVDWRASARSQKLMVRPQQDAHTRGLVLCLDRSASFLIESHDRDFAQRRLALALGLRCLQSKAELAVVAGAQFCSFKSVGQSNDLQNFLSELATQPSTDLSLELVPKSFSADELVLLGSPWSSHEGIAQASFIATRLRSLLLVSERECNLPNQKVMLQHAASEEQLNVDWHANPAQSRFDNHVEAQLRRLRQYGFDSASLACPAAADAVKLIESSHEFLLH